MSDDFTAILFGIPDRELGNHHTGQGAAEVIASLVISIGLDGLTEKNFSEFIFRIHDDRL